MRHPCSNTFTIIEPSSRSPLLTLVPTRPLSLTAHRVRSPQSTATPYGTSTSNGRGLLDPILPFFRPPSTRKE